MDEQQALLEIRGDLTTFLILRNQELWRAHAQRLTELVGSLERVNVPQTTADGKETQGAILIKALKFLATEAAAIHKTNEDIIGELSAYGEQYEVGSTPAQAVEKIVAGLREANPVYKAMTDEQIKDKLGINDAVTSH